MSKLVRENINDYLPGPSGKEIKGKIQKGLQKILKKYPLENKDEIVAIALDWADESQTFQEEGRIYPDDIGSKEDFGPEVRTFLENTDVEFVENRGDAGGGWPELIFEDPKYQIYLFLEKFYNQEGDPESTFEVVKIGS